MMGVAGAGYDAALHGLVFAPRPDRARVRVTGRDPVGMLQGVVSRGDLLKVFLRPDEEMAEEMRDSVLTSLPSTEAITVTVTEGVVTLGGSLPERGLMPVLARAVRAVEGVVDIRLDLSHR